MEEVGCAAAEAAIRVALGALGVLTMSGALPMALGWAALSALGLA